MNRIKPMAVFATLLMLSACAGAPGIDQPTSNARLVAGPPISDIVTPFDKALTCLKGKVSPKLVFSVGAIIDQTGKETFTDGGTGKFVTQGAGDMVQSALFKAGTTVVNRRDPRVMTTEVEWQIRDAKRQVPTNFYITGSINSLDFIPGSGAEVEVVGVGAKYRQNRILIGLDLALTEANTGVVVANVPLHKQIFSSEAGVSAGRFFGDSLVLADIGGREREALHFSLRQMLYLATFELLTQVMKVKNYAECRSYIDRAHGYVDNTKTAKAVAEEAKLQSVSGVGALPPLATNRAVKAPAVPPSDPPKDEGSGVASGSAAVPSDLPRDAGSGVASGSAAVPSDLPRDAGSGVASGSFAPSNGNSDEIQRDAKTQSILLGD